MVKNWVKMTRLKTRRRESALGWMTLSYVLALGLLGLLSWMNYRLMATQIETAKDSTAFLTSASQLRTFLLRSALLAQSLGDAPLSQREGIRRDLTAAIRELESVHGQWLRIEAGLRRTRDFDAEIAQFVADAQSLIADIPVQITPSDPRLKALRAAAAPSELLGLLDALVGEYQSQNALDVARLQHLQRWNLTASLVVLTATGLLVFRPMKRRIQREMTKLQAAETYNRAIVETAEDGILAIDESGRIESANPAAERILGCASGALAGQSAMAFLPWPPSISSAANGVSEVVGHRADGASFPMDLAVGETGLNDHRLFIVIVRDITERKRLENLALQSERLAVIGQMSAQVAHEIRNPLGSITLNLDLVRKEIDTLGASSRHSPREGRELVDILRGEARRIQRVIEDYLRFARLRKPQRQSVRLHDLIEQKLGFLHAVFEQSRVELRTQFDASLPPVWVDAEQIWQALLNLLHNALEAMPDGGTLTLQTARVGDRAVVRVTDSGRGMTDDQVRQLFTPFHSTKPGGTGLGLALAQQIISEHGGRIECQSDPGRGTTFTVWLPLAEET